MVPLPAPRCGARLELTNRGTESNMLARFRMPFVFVGPEGLAVILFSLLSGFSRRVLLDFPVGCSTHHLAQAWPVGGLWDHEQPSL